jgi:hypothetical protein
VTIASKSILQAALIGVAMSGDTNNNKSAYKKNTIDFRDNGFKVKAPSGSEWWYKAKALQVVEVVEEEPKPFKLGDTVTLAPGAFSSLSGKAKVAKAAPKPKKTAAKKSPLSTALPSSSEWMPAAGEALAVCSLFHPSSQRGILVSSLTDPTRLWVAAASDLVPVRDVPISHLYRAGDFVQLDAAYEEKLVKCLGAPAEGRTGRVISAGYVRKGVQRNIEVAFVAERAAGDSSDAEDGGDIVVSLYSALELLPAPFIRYTSSCTSMMADDEKLELIAILNELSEATKIPLVGSRLVDKFGDGVFSKLWPVFAGHKDTYVAAFKAFSTWHLRRLSHAHVNHNFLCK